MMSWMHGAFRARLVTTPTGRSGAVEAGMNHPLRQIEQYIGLADELQVSRAARWGQLAQMLGYANVAPLVADLRVAYNYGSMARAMGRPCSPFAFKGVHANAWVDGWLGLKKPEA